MDSDWGERIGYFVVLLLSLTVHEWAHAMSAYKLGDDTAARMGRLTLNPFAHIDPIGTVLLPLLRVPFGWAKPVPIDSSRFRRDVPMGTGIALSAAAGPLSNVMLALLCTLLTGLVQRFLPELWIEEEGVRFLLTYGFVINVLLALFNMLPLPPLDGSRVVDGLLPYRYRPQWERFTRIAPVILIGIIVLPFITDGRVSLLNWPIRVAFEGFHSAVTFIRLVGR